MGTGPPPTTKLASSDNLATLLCTKPPELEAQEAVRADESLFLQPEGGWEAGSTRPAQSTGGARPAAAQALAHPAKPAAGPHSWASLACPANLAELGSLLTKSSATGKVKDTGKGVKITQAKGRGGVVGNGICEESLTG